LARKRYTPLDHRGSTSGEICEAKLTSKLGNSSNAMVLRSNLRLYIFGYLYLLSYFCISDRQNEKVLSFYILFCSASTAVDWRFEPTLLTRAKTHFPP
jgi:hypothetical protein